MTADCTPLLLSLFQIGQPKDVRRVPKSQVATFNTPTAAEETIAYNLRVQEAVKRRDWHKFKGIDMGLRHDDIFYNEMDDEIVTVSTTEVFCDNFL